MRLYATVASLAVVLGLAGAASAQQASFFPAIGQTQNVVVDTRNPLAPIAQPMFTNNAWAKLTSFFPLNVGTVPAQFIGGQSSFPTPGQLPNADYLQSFGFYRARQARSSNSWFGR